jgi:hypothetical protein
MMVAARRGDLSWQNAAGHPTQQGHRIRMTTNTKQCRLLLTKNINKNGSSTAKYCNAINFLG